MPLTLLPPIHAEKVDKIKTDTSKPNHAAIIYEAIDSCVLRILLNDPRTERKRFYSEDLTREEGGGPSPDLSCHLAC